MVISFSSAQYKNQIFANIKKLKDNDDWKGIHLTDDITLEEKNIRRGSTIIVAGQSFNYDEINNLPFDISLENAKMVKTPDGLAFQSPHAVFSNLYKCPMKYEGQNFDSTERAYYSKMCIISDNMALHRRVMTAKTPMDCMFVAKNCKKNAEWYDMEDDVMIALQKTKFADPTRHIIWWTEERYTLKILCI